MTFEILISTMHCNFFNKNSVIPDNTLIINQHSKESTMCPNIKNVYNFKESGLSRSRNHAIDLCTGNICHISDDDLVYIENIKEIILNAFNDNPSADIITFQVQLPNTKLYKDYKKEKFWHTRKSIMGVMSVEIAFRSQAIKDYNLKFDENFGLGAAFPTGEENIFLSDALKKGLNILYIPLPIVIHPLETSGKNYADTSIIEAKGAMLYRIFGFLGYPVSFVFAYRQYKYSALGLNEFYSTMLRGIKKYGDRHE